MRPTHTEYRNTCCFGKGDYFKATRAENSFRLKVSWHLPHNRLIVGSNPAEPTRVQRQGKKGEGDKDLHPNKACQVGISDNF